MQTPKVSVIVPVYNAEPYLRRCLDSILAQTFTDFEAILVDDGSTDQCGAICDEYAAKDCRFIVVHQENQGVSVTRQVGLDAAKGEFIIHADPDDWVDSKWLESLYRDGQQSGADIIICDIVKVYRDRVLYQDQRPTSFAIDDILLDFLNRKTWGSCCNKLVKRSLIIKYNIRFHSEMTLWEDLYFVCMLLTHNPVVSYIPKGLYYYDMYHNGNSITRNKKDCHIRSCMVFISSLEPILADDIYSESWYKRKVLVKKMIFVKGDSEYSAKDVYPEINARFIAEAKRYKPWVTESLMKDSICGHPHLAFSLFCLFQRLRKVKNIKNKLSPL